MNKNIVSLRKADIRLNLSSKERFKEAIERSAIRFKTRRNLYDISSLFKYKSVWKVEFSGKKQTNKKIIVIPQNKEDSTEKKVENIEKILCKTTLKDSSLFKSSQNKIKSIISESSNQKNLLTSRKYMNTNIEVFSEKKQKVQNDYTGSTKISSKPTSSVGSSNSLVTYKNGIIEEVQDNNWEDETPIPDSIATSKQINRYLLRTKKI